MAPTATGVGGLPVMKSLVSVHRAFTGTSVEIPDQEISVSVQDKIERGFDPHQPQAARRYACLLNGYASDNACAKASTVRKMDLLHLLLRAYDPRGCIASDDTAGIRSLLGVVDGWLRWLHQNRLDSRYQYSVRVDNGFRELKPSLYEGDVLGAEERQYLLDLLTELANLQKFTGWLRDNSGITVQLDGSEIICAPNIARGLSVQHFISELYSRERERARKLKVALNLQLRWHAGLGALGIQIGSNGGSRLPGESLSSILRSIDPGWYAQPNESGEELILPTGGQLVNWSELMTILWPAIRSIEETVDRLARGERLDEEEEIQFRENLELMSDIIIKLEGQEFRRDTQIDHVLAAFRDCYKSVFKPHKTLKFASDQLEEKYGIREVYWEKRRVLAVKIAPQMYKARCFVVSLGHIFNGGRFPNVTLTFDVPLPYFSVVNWDDAHNLLHRLLSAAALFASGANPVHLHLSIDSDVKNDSATILLDDRSDGQYFIKRLAAIETNRHLYPEFLWAIRSHAVRVAPRGANPSLVSSPLRFPIATANPKPKSD